MLFVIFLIVIIEVKWRPRIDIAEENKVFLWYNKKNNRAYIQIL